jgi:hypothetical protein
MERPGTSGRVVVQVHRKTRDWDDGRLMGPKLARTERVGRSAAYGTGQKFDIDLLAMTLYVNRSSRDAHAGFLAERAATRFALLLSSRRPIVSNNRPYRGVAKCVFVSPSRVITARFNRRPWNRAGSSLLSDHASSIEISPARWRIALGFRRAIPSFMGDYTGMNWFLIDKNISLSRDSDPRQRGSLKTLARSIGRSLSRKTPGMILNGVFEKKKKKEWFMHMEGFISEARLVEPLMHSVC